MGVTVLVWSPRVAPGLLTAAAWDLVRAAPCFLVGTAHPLESALREAGAEVALLSTDFERAAADALSAGSHGEVVLVPRAEGDHELLAAVALATEVPMTVLVGSADLPGAQLLDLVAVMDRLRSPGGCAWDADQTHRSLVTYLVEETYETVEAIETDDLTGLREELGDLLLQVVFHARIGQEHQAEPWSIDDVAQGITDKLVRRHPHVFGIGAEAAVAVDAAELEGRWDRLKAAEKQRTSAVDGVPLGQPALSLAAKLHDRAQRAGVAPELDVPTALQADDPSALGHLLLAVVVGARRAGLDPEAALREASRRYADAVREGESAAGISRS